MGAVEVFEAVKSRLSDGFGVDDLEWAAKELVKAAWETLPGRDGKERLAWVKKTVIAAVESVDHLIPVLGLWMDNPIADALQAQAVNAVVDKYLGALIEWAYAVESANRLAALAA